MVANYSFDYTHVRIYTIPYKDALIIIRLNMENSIVAIKLNLLSYSIFYLIQIHIINRLKGNPPETETRTNK